MPVVRTGLERILSDQAHLLKGARVGLICNPASVTKELDHAVDLFHRRDDFELTAIFGPQHGSRAEEQANMIESRDATDAQTGLPVYSLYSETRKPTEKMLKNVDILVFDMQDVGSRYYTYIYTMALAMEACVQYQKKMVVLDRPNPINGEDVEGNVLNPKLKSFVGLHPLAIRHGMTVGELAKLFRAEFAVKCELEVVAMEGWRRKMFYEETGLPWVFPSPNMPTVDSAVVYPGMCLFEGTNLSEGRGTTKPFELFGAPFIDPWKLLPALEQHKLPGVYFRPCHYKPTFDKWKDELCGGFQMHITDRKAFKPFLTALAILREVIAMYREKFAWKDPPYEYEYKKLPFDILSGDLNIRKYLEKGRPLKDFEDLWQNELSAFLKKRENYFLYR